VANQRVQGGVYDATEKVETFFLRKGWHLAPPGSVGSPCMKTDAFMTDHISNLAK
jgi:hypothetical protein